MDHPRYFSAGAYYLQRFGKPMQKAVIDADFSCPNLDGTLSYGGCTFCSGGSGHFTPSGTIPEQIAAERTRIARTHPDAGIIAYFQAHTNTYGTPEHLRRCYTLALAQSGVEALAVRDSSGLSAGACAGRAVGHCRTDCPHRGAGTPDHP